MKIDSSTIGMESARKYQSTRTVSRNFKITQYRASLNSSSSLYADAGGSGQTLMKEASSERENETSEKNLNQTAADWQNRFGLPAARMNIRSASDNVLNDIRQMTLRYIFNLFFGGRRRSAFFDDEISRINSGQTKNLDDIFQTDGLSSQNVQNSPDGQNVRLVGNNAVMPQTVIFNALNLSADCYESEQEDTAFSTVGHVRTSDGREIDFNVNVGMSRSFERYYREEVQLTKASLCDPLVINLDTDVAELEDQTFYFDIDADGELDEISELGAKSGYLALDKNGDGKINDGSELFGTASGDGFKDLAAYDEDHNGWIDENDSVWSKLKIWTKDSQGRDVLYSLADKNVGAVYLGNVSTEHTLKGDDGNIKGAIRNSGVFLYENGNVGTIQHVDVAKYAKLA